MKLDNERLSDPDWDERPEIDEDDDWLDLDDSGEWVVSDFVTDQGLTADGYTLLAAMDSQGDFI
jgi:hypothetical protein